MVTTLLPSPESFSLNIDSKIHTEQTKSNQFFYNFREYYPQNIMFDKRV